MRNQLKNIPVVILVGGLGTRLRSVVSDRPKPLARIGDKTNLDIIMDNLFTWGFQDIILATGYMREKVREHVASRVFPKGVQIFFSEEEKPLGTGGAIKKALGAISRERYIVMNGDAFCNVHFEDFLDFHIAKQSLLSLVVLPRLVEWGGGIELDHTHRIISFEENTPEVRTHLSAGIYIMEESIQDHLPQEDIFSIEKDFFPHIINQKSVFGFPMTGETYDIGTPERYARVQKILTQQ